MRLASIIWVVVAAAAGAGSAARAAGAGPEARAAGPAPAVGAARAASLDLSSAIQRALARSPSLRAGESAVAAARDDASAAQAGHLPTLELGARAVRTDEPAGAFALRLDEGRLSAPDFDPARLNSPAAVGGLGLSATLNLPLYQGGRTRAGAQAARGLAQAEEESQQRRKQQVSFAVARAYFGTRAAAQAVAYADDAVQSARENERFVRERVGQGLLLEADALRNTAFRADAEARLAEARRALGSSRAALAMLLGEAVDPEDLTTPLEDGSPLPQAEPDRPDLRAAALRAGVAQAQARGARGSLLPEVFFQASAQTLRSSFDQGTTWTALLVGARWELSIGALHTAAAARAREVAADASAQAAGEDARLELEEARLSITAAAARTTAAREAVTASTAARALRLSRHREGLLPLTELLDAELALSNARALLVRSLLEARLARASLQLALGQPIEAAEGVKP